MAPNKKGRGGGFLFGPKEEGGGGVFLFGPKQEGGGGFLFGPKEEGGGGVLVWRQTRGGGGGSCSGPKKNPPHPAIGAIWKQHNPKPQTLIFHPMQTGEQRSHIELPREKLGFAGGKG